MFKIATTETYDPTLCIDEWVNRSNDYDFLLYITKVLNSRIIEILTDSQSPWAYMNKPSVLHLTVTGWGGTELELGVCYPTEMFLKIKDLIEAGYPKERIVLRIDPIIPTWEACASRRHRSSNASARIPSARPAASPACPLRTSPCSTSGSSRGAAKPGHNVSRETISASNSRLLFHVKHFSPHGQTVRQSAPFAARSRRSHFPGGRTSGASRMFRSSAVPPETS